MPRFQVRTITPDDAAAILERNTHNRPLGHARINEYAGALQRGEWALNGEAIKLSGEWEFNGAPPRPLTADGFLLDGQHRLAAIIAAGAPMTTAVVDGLPADAQETLDTGRRRTFGDVLALRGTAYATTIASAARIVYGYEKDGIPRTQGIAPPPTHAQLLAVLDRHPRLADSIHVSGHTGPVLSVSRATVTGMHYLMALADRRDADTFWQRLDDGVDLDADSPVTLLRNRLIRAAIGNGRLDERARNHFTVRAWNAYRTRERLGSLRIADRFPRIVGCPVPVATDRTHP